MRISKIKKINVKINANFFRKKNNAGFTLFELLLIISAFAIIIAISVPFSNSSIIRGNLDTSVRLVESSLRRTYTYARAGENNSNWGTRITNTNVVVFSGSSYNGRNSTFDEINNMPSDIVLGDTLAVNGVVDIIFSKNSGSPNRVGSMTMTANNDTKTITINELSAISITSN
jgi:Tfp pilus assembly protein FimT